MDDIEEIVLDDFPVISSEYLDVPLLTEPFDEKKHKRDLEVKLKPQKLELQEIPELDHLDHLPKKYQHHYREKGAKTLVDILSWLLLILACGLFLLLVYSLRGA